MDDAPGRNSPNPKGRDEDGELKARSRQRILWVLVPIVLVIAWGIYGHWQRYAAAKATQRETIDFVPSVRVAKAKREAGPVKVTLPGETQSFDIASIYARATGYIAERHVDIGNRVKRGDLLLKISSPDLDAQLAQAGAQLEQTRASLIQTQAQVQQSQANVKLANTTNKRTSTLAGEGYASRQDADNSGANVQVQAATVAAAQAAVQVAQANVDAQIATVQRLQQLTAYEQVTAPFDGVVTTRNIDVGDLVSADVSGATPMFVVAHDDTLRVAVQVPQSEATALTDGVAAEITVPEMPGRTFHGAVTRSAVALSSTSRTLLLQVDLPNADHALHPGLFVGVTFEVPRDQPRVVVPDEALIFDPAGEQVAVVQPGDTISMRTVMILRDLGTEAELSDGLSGDEMLVLSAPADLVDGGKVKIETNPPPGQQANR
jgi:RND family efflux transporter MFP subunit